MKNLIKFTIFSFMNLELKQERIFLIITYLTKQNVMRKSKSQSF